MDEFTASRMGLPRIIKYFIFRKVDSHEKRTLSLLVAALLTMSMLCSSCVPALADSTAAGNSETAPVKYTREEYTYTLDDNGNATITGYSGEEAELNIPSELDGHTITALGDEAFYPKSF